MSNASEVAAKKMPNKTILLVEDDPVNVKGVVHILRRAGYNVLVATDGESSVKQAQQDMPDLILLDVLMPGIDGFETCRHLKENEATRDIPVIFMTGLTETTDKVKGFELGAVDYITKPIQAAEMLARVNTHLTLRSLQQGLQQQIAEHEKLIAELDAFAHTVAHDLKGPLGSVIGFAELIRADFANATSEEALIASQAIYQSGLKMRDIIDGLLLLASVRREDVIRQPLDMGNIVNEAMQRLVYTIRELQAEVNVPAEWPTALGYGPWVEEIWINYLSNALKYGGKPPRIELSYTVQPDRAIRFWVRDNGQGLTPEEQQKLFTPFTRINQAGTKGHGLGLSIVRRIVERLDGTVGVESKVGQGSLFYFTLSAAP